MLECAEFVDRAAERCKARGAQMTPIRRDVLSLLHASEHGLKAYDLLARIKALRSNATPPTVYRALDFLMEQGLVHKIERLNQFVICRHESHQFPGVFMVCRRCGKLSELQDPALMAAFSRSVERSGHHLACHELEIATICPDCR
ncbi:MAG: transcriptional repressor [Azonexaceae bacterium]|jgi:Fur family zinc uptake transcriptional regulator|uniref:Fur family transcriptional regulator n=1 Tax=Azonexus sp. R2A61 TaxID=2744443 RepID=UPI001F311B68|nr:Fur family transcriptional regulator [Azonexus sp. R2A61]MCE1239798.1 transcriptional repressor [Azonexaceae bacterium]